MRTSALEARAFGTDPLGAPPQVCYGKRRIARLVN
jgi:hypothetical protein